MDVGVIPDLANSDLLGIGGGGGAQQVSQAPTIRQTPNISQASNINQVPTIKAVIKF